MTKLSIEEQSYQETLKQLTDALRVSLSAASKVPRACIDNNGALSYDYSEVEELAKMLSKVTTFIYGEPKEEK